MTCAGPKPGRPPQMSSSPAVRCDPRPGPRTELALEAAMIRSRTVGVLILTIAALDLLGAGALRGQSTDSTALSSRLGPPATVFSIGQPPIWRQQFTAQGTAYAQGGRYGATFSYGVFHSFNKP